MPRARTVCNVPGCPELTDKGRCIEHRRQAERARGTRQQRGYNATHDRLRAQWAPKVATGSVTCARCQRRISSVEPWDLGHDDNDRTKWCGPEHQHCNRSAGGQAAHTPPGG